MARACFPSPSEGLETTCTFMMQRTEMVRVIGRSSLLMVLDCQNSENWESPFCGDSYRNRQRQHAIIAQQAQHQRHGIKVFTGEYLGSLSLQITVEIDDRHGHQQMAPATRLSIREAQSAIDHLADERIRQHGTG